MQKFFSIQNKFLFVVVVMSGLIFTHCGSTTSDALPTASLPLPENDTAEIITAGASSSASAATDSSPTLSFARKTVPAAKPLYSIANCTFDSATGDWACNAASTDITVTLRFYKASDDSLITVDVTDTANYFPGGTLFGISAPGNDDTGIKIEILVDVEKTLVNGTVLSFNTTTGKLLATDANTDATATFSHTGTGSISGTFTPQIIDSDATSAVELTLSAVAYTAAGLGSDVDGTYEFSGTVGDTTYTGSAAFDEDGCNGATIKDENGTVLGTAVLNDNGDLIFTDSEDNVTTLDR